MLFFLIIIFSSCQKQVDWTKTYESQKKNPFGLFIFKEELKKQHKAIDSNSFIDIRYNTEEFINKEIISYSNDSFYSKLDLCYIYINTSNYISDGLFKKMGDIAYLDNKIFIATTNFSDSICNLLGIDIQYEMISKFDKKEITLENQNFYKSYNLKMIEEKVYYFDSIPIQNVEILGYITIGNKSYPNFIKINPNSSNQGGVYLHLAPELFTNYHLLNQNDYQYAFECIQLISNKKYMYWDGYETQERYINNFNNLQENLFDSIRFFMSKPALKLAFLFFLSIFVLLILFNYKRIQNPIPIYLSKKNNTIEYIKTISLLYIYEKNLKPLCQHKLNYFFNFLKTQFQLNGELDKAQLLLFLTYKTNIDSEWLQYFVENIEEIKSKKEVSKKEFENFSKLLNQFYKNIKNYGK